MHQDVPNERLSRQWHRLEGEDSGVGRMSLDEQREQPDVGSYVDHKCAIIEQDVGVATDSKDLPVLPVRIRSVRGKPLEILFELP